MMKKMVAAMISATMLSLTGSMLPADALETQPHELTESEVLELVCAELGIADFDAYVADLAARLNCDADSEGTRDNCPFDPDDYIDIYTGGSSNGRIDSADSIFLLQFLNGTVNYPYVLTDLDPNQDHIIDRADAQALLDCFAQVIVLDMYPDFVPGSHGSTRTPDAARTYRHFDFQSKTEDTNPYTIPTPSNSLNMKSNDTKVTSVVQTRGTYFNCMDSRIVCTPGSGVIIGDHIIATNAHCLVDLTTGEFNENCFVNLLTYPENNPYNPTYTSLTIVSLHVPSDYLQKDINGNYIYNPTYGWIYFNRPLDYGLIVVEESLSSYGSFHIGLPLDGLEYGANGTPLTLMAFPENKDLQNNSNMNNNHERVRPLTSYGVLDSLLTGTITHTCECTSGSSGGAIFTNLAFNNTSYETMISLHAANGIGVRITQPFLPFYLNNPVVEQDLEAIE